MCSRKWWNVSFVLFVPTKVWMDNYLSEYRFWTIWCDILATRGSYSQPQVTWDNVVFFVFAFLQFFKIFYVRLGKKRKNVSFYRGVCMCKGKTNTCYFFFLFIFCTFPLVRILLVDPRLNTVNHLTNFWKDSPEWWQPWWETASSQCTSYSAIPLSTLTQQMMRAGVWRRWPSKHIFFLAN